METGNENRTRSPRKRSYASAVSEKRSKSREKMPRCDSVTSEMHKTDQEVNSKQRRLEAAISPIQERCEEKSPRHSPRKSSRKSPTKSAKNMTFEDLLSQDESMKNASWAAMVEEASASSVSKSTADVFSPQKTPPKNNDKMSHTKLKYKPDAELSEKVGLSMDAKMKSDRRDRKKDKSKQTKITDFSMLRRSPRKERSSPPPSGSPRKRKNGDIASPMQASTPAQSPTRRFASRSRHSTTSNFDDSDASFKSPNIGGRGHRAGKGRDLNSSRRSVEDASSNKKQKTNVTQEGEVDLPIPNPRPKDFQDPTLGWVNDTKVIDKREKDITKGKDSPAYKKYADMIPRKARLSKDIHPSTPNKFINYSRRSWDTQVRLWRRKLYTVIGQDYNDASSLRSGVSRISRCSSSANETDHEIGTSADVSFEEIDHPHSDAEDIPLVGAPGELTNMGNILAGFDIDSQQGTCNNDDKTMQGTDDDNTLQGFLADPAGPTDFSALLEKRA